MCCYCRPSHRERQRRLEKWAEIPSSIDMNAKISRIIDAVNTLDENQHFVSQVLLRRFMISGRLQSYNVQTEKWKSASPKRVFSESGYNQLLVYGQVDNTLEDAFSKVETSLPKTFMALEQAANKPSTELRQRIYENICWYCAFLWRISPFAKAAAPVDFVYQIEKELEDGRADTLREVLRMPEETIELFREAHSRGSRIVVDSADFLQLVYRIQFRRGYQLAYSTFRYRTRWTICKSPVELPLSDIALVQFHRKDLNAIYYILPIGRKLLLKGRVNLGDSENSSQTFIKGENLTITEAEYWLHVICSSAVRELISSHKIADIPAIRSRTKRNGITFPTIVTPELASLPGVRDFTGNFVLRLVSEDEFVKFVHSFIKPPTPLSQSVG
jgi:hypothetical protein